YSPNGEFDLIPGRVCLQDLIKENCGGSSRSLARRAAALSSLDRRAQQLVEVKFCGFAVLPRQPGRLGCDRSSDNLTVRGRGRWRSRLSLDIAAPRVACFFRGRARQPTNRLDGASWLARSAVLPFTFFPAPAFTVGRRQVRNFRTSFQLGADGGHRLVRY